MAQTPKMREARRARTLQQISLLFSALTLATPAYAEATTRIITVAPSIPSSVPQFVDDKTFTSAILNSTNLYRDEHNATSLVWNETLEAFATDYLHSKKVGADCEFAHSGGPYGENLAIGYPNATASIEAWGNERDEYNFGKPGFTEKTGHFTQLVWKSTSDVGCGRRLCGQRGWYLACEYWPPGNVIGAFKDEVDKENDATQVGPGSLGLIFTIGALVWSIL
ncbi:CAP domain-containing protein [Astrocystis sublimbata]|nr:CAP domain-containing protein [Astrocystis sublimbata]